MTFNHTPWTRPDTVGDLHQVHTRPSRAVQVCGTSSSASGSRLCPGISVNALSDLMAPLNPSTQVHAGAEIVDVITLASTSAAAAASSSPGLLEVLYDATQKMDALVSTQLAGM